VTDQSTSPETTDQQRTPRAESKKPEELWRDVLGRQLRALRRSRHETLDAVASRANVSLPYLSEVERGIKEPSSEIVAAISAALETSLLDLTEAVAAQLRQDRAAEPASTSRGHFTLAA
jgi:transcriptional regulator with XRE-family HTH domain